MVVPGHPRYAAGTDTSVGDAAFSELYATLDRAGVDVVMAGDTHAFEYYVDHVDGVNGVRPVYHFVNGGGGAYLSFGTALAWPERPPVADWAYYPNHAAVTQKIETTTPRWKRPAWWWTREFGAWPFSAEWLSAAFDYNVAPFFQSFVEVRVERSSRRIVLRPWGVHGRLTWGDLASSPAIRPAGITSDTPVEWTVPMSRP
jgi:hypothetical protein